MNLTKILSNNIDLPELPAWQARSFWAMLLAVIATLANAAGIDLWGLLSEIGAGATPDEVIATGERAIGAWQAVAPLLLGLWAWIERRAPNYRLTLFRKSEVDSLRMLGAILFALVLAGGLLIGSSWAALAQGLRCMPEPEMAAALVDDYGERIVASATASGGQPVLVFANIKSGTWTMIVLIDGSACVLGAGDGWMQGTEIGEPA